MLPCHRHEIYITLIMIELIEFGDYVCPRCRKARLPLTQVLWSFTSQIQYTYRHFPNQRNPESRLAALAAEAARRQGKFGLMYHALFTQPTINPSTLLAIALRIGLEPEQFLNDLCSGEVVNRIEADQQAGYQLSVHATPTLVIEGHRFHGSLTLARMSPFIRQHIRRKSSTVLDLVDPRTGQVRWADSIL